MSFDHVKVSLNGFAILFITLSANCERKLRHLLKTYLLSTLTMCPQIFYICEVGKIGKYLILSKGIKATFFVVKTKKIIILAACSGFQCGMARSRTGLYYSRGG